MLRPKLRIQQYIENCKWVYKIQRRQWFLWLSLPNHTYQTRGEAQEQVLNLRAEYDYDGEKPWRLSIQ